MLDFVEKALGSLTESVALFPLLFQCGHENDRMNGIFCFPCREQKEPGGNDDLHCMRWRRSMGTEGRKVRCERGVKRKRMMVDRQTAMYPIRPTTAKKKKAASPSAALGDQCMHRYTTRQTKSDARMTREPRVTHRALAWDCSMLFLSSLTPLLSEGNKTPSSSFWQTRSSFF